MANLSQRTVITLSPDEKLNIIIEALIEAQKERQQIAEYLEDLSEKLDNLSRDGVDYELEYDEDK